MCSKGICSQVSLNTFIPLPINTRLTFRLTSLICGQHLIILYLLRHLIDSHTMVNQVSSDLNLSINTRWHVCRKLGCVSLRKSKIGFLNLKETGNGFCNSLLDRSFESLRSWCVKGTDPLIHHRTKDLGLICLVTKHKIQFSIFSDLQNPISTDCWTDHQLRCGFMAIDQCPATDAFST